MQPGRQGPDFPNEAYVMYDDYAKARLHTCAVAWPAAANPVTKGAKHAAEDLARCVSAWGGEWHGTYYGKLDTDNSTGDVTLPPGMGGGYPYSFLECDVDGTGSANTSAIQCQKLARCACVCVRVRALAGGRLCGACATLCRFGICIVCVLFFFKQPLAAHTHTLAMITAPRASACAAVARRCRRPSFATTSSTAVPRESCVWGGGGGGGRKRGREGGREGGSTRCRLSCC